MKVVITNTVTLNTGDAAILRGLIKTLRAAFGSSVEIVVIERSAAAASRYNPDLVFKQAFLTKGVLAKKRAMLASKHQLFRLLLPALGRENFEEMRSADLIISTGGTYLVPHYDMTDKLVQLFLARQSGKPVVMFTQSLGPFPTRKLATAIRKVTSSMSLILLRDEQSRRHLAEAGADVSKAIVVPDAAFVLADEGRLTGAAKRSLGEGLKVAISVREWKFPESASRAEASDKYSEAIRAAVSHLVNVHDASVTFLSSCQGIAEYWTDDSRTAEAIVSGLPEPLRARVKVDRNYHTPEQLMDILAGFDLVIATRMHMAVLALCAGTPVLPVAYEFKTQEMFADLGFGDWILDINSITEKAILEQIDRCLAELPTRRDELIAGVLSQHSSAVAAVDFLRDRIAH